MFCYLTFFNIIDTITLLKQEAPLFFWTLLNIFALHQFESHATLKFAEK